MHAPLRRLPHDAQVRATYLEIYNEQIIDLINPGGPLSVRGSHNASGGFFVEDLSVVQARRTCPAPAQGPPPRSPPRDARQRVGASPESDA